MWVVDRGLIFAFEVFGGADVSEPGWNHAGGKTSRSLTAHVTRRPRRQVFSPPSVPRTPRPPLSPAARVADSSRVISDFRGSLLRKCFFPGEGAGVERQICTMSTSMAAVCRGRDGRLVREKPFIGWPVTNLSLSPEFELRRPRDHNAWLMDFGDDQSCGRGATISM